MFDGFSDVLVFLYVWISGFFDFWIPRRIIQCCSPSVLLMFDLVDVSGAWSFFCTIRNRHVCFNLDCCDSLITREVKSEQLMWSSCFLFTLFTFGHDTQPTCYFYLADDVGSDALI